MGPESVGRNTHRVFRRMHPQKILTHIDSGFAKRPTLGNLLLATTLKLLIRRRHTGALHIHAEHQLEQRRFTGEALFLR